jgi:hypothetical protein
LIKNPCFLGTIFSHRALQAIREKMVPKKHGFFIKR